MSHQQIQTIKETDNTLRQTLTFAKGKLDSIKISDNLILSFLLILTYNSTLPLIASQNNLIIQISVDYIFWPKGVKVTLFMYVHMYRHG